MRDLSLCGRSGTGNSNFSPFYRNSPTLRNARHTPRVFYSKQPTMSRSDTLFRRFAPYGFAQNDRRGTALSLITKKRGLIPRFPVIIILLFAVVFQSCKVLFQLRRQSVAELLIVARDFVRFAAPTLFIDIENLLQIRFEIGRASCRERVFILV